MFDVCPYAKTRFSTAITLVCQLIMLGTGFIRSIGIFAFVSVIFEEVKNTEFYHTMKPLSQSTFFSIAIASIYLPNSAFRFRCKYLKLLARVKLIIGDRRRF